MGGVFYYMFGDIRMTPETPFGRRNPPAPFFEKIWYLLVKDIL
jgi:hypothetical protein